MQVKLAFSVLHSLAAGLWRRLGLVADDPGTERDWLRSPPAPPPLTDQELGSRLPSITEKVHFENGDR
jgi:hypothetical protein